MPLFGSRLSLPEVLLESLLGTLPCETPPGSAPDVFVAVSFGVPVVESVVSPQAVKAAPEINASAVSNPASERRMFMARPYEEFDIAASRTGKYG
ncbi:MAG TPA: hypothetical protein VGO95_00875 [Modestobacter sp.]|nr:hypothetical protein [Modestobacter sp.]